jgi:putative membrane-bound dehydrogenase-like protein
VFIQCLQRFVAIRRLLGRCLLGLTRNSNSSTGRAAAGFSACAILLCFSASAAEINPAADAPQPLPPEESARRFKLPPGFRIELVASEPLIREPSGVCWDEQGRLFVCELHGYNLEGHLDVQDLNQTGVLDHEVRRIPANPRAQEEAKKDTFGTVKLLLDDDSDGRMDKAVVFADRLPPCYGICPARGGIIVACAPDIVFLADRDGDGKAEVRETLFTGFATGALERGINQPQWGLDNWIYFGRGHSGGLITGPHLKAPVRLGGTDFRIKPDGSVIEPVTGATHTFGHAFTEDGERFTATTSVPGLYVTPLPWRYLARNPDAAAPRTEQDVGGDKRVYPTGRPHPWRVKRAEDPGFFKFYRDRYGAGDSDAGGWFTSACGPLVYQDVAWPAEYRGQYFVCEPAQNLIHRAVIERDGPGLRLRRAPGEEASEFLTSSDQWFHPIYLAHGPDGAVYICDFYREIIEDYSAIPRYLQQQYGLIAGQNHGRLWRLPHRDAPGAPAADMSKLGADELAKEVTGLHFWRRQTARRLLLERNTKAVAPALTRLLQSSAGVPPAQFLNALYTLHGLNALQPGDVEAALEHSNAQVRVHGMGLSEPWLDVRPTLMNSLLALTDDRNEKVLLQLALSLGASKDGRALPTLARLAREHGDVKWMPNAILSSSHGRAVELLALLLQEPPELHHGRNLLEPLLASIGARRDAREMAQTLIAVASVTDADLQKTCLKGLRSGLKNVRSLSLPVAGRDALKQLLGSTWGEVRSSALALLNMADPAQRKALLAQAARDAGDVKLSAEARLGAVSQLAAADDPSATTALLAAWPASTPKVREAILDAIFARRDRLPALLDALEQNAIPANALTAFQRVTLLEHDKAEIRGRVTRLLNKPSGVSDETFLRFAAALADPRDQAHGEQIFREHCATCHQARGLGFAVGPDLGAEFQRAEEAILKDILTPNDTISAGYPTYVIETTSGQSHNGILSSESATSLTLRQAAGAEQVILRKDVARFESLPVSLMPEALAQTLQPNDAADVIAWLRSVPSNAPPAPDRVVLFDDETEFIAKLTEGEGRATLVTGDGFAGKACLAVTPPQRYSARIAGWNFRVVEKPGPGEFRYLRLAWKTRAGQGVMLELAADGRWPDAQEPRRRYFAGKNTTRWQAREVSPGAPTDWQVVTLDLWKDNGAFMLTGLAPTAMGGTAFFDRIELLSRLDEAAAR